MVAGYEELQCSNMRFLLPVLFTTFTASSTCPNVDIPQDKIIGFWVSETFFIKGNVFYNLKNNNQAERILIKTCEAIQSDPGFIILKINDRMYDVARCYVPQEGKYENLSFILKSLLKDPIFKNSKNPKYLPDNLLEPNVLFGTVIDYKTGETIKGTEVFIPSLRQRRISDEEGKFAFTIDKPGVY